jgi:carbohydrate kinase (thermoresistant glucokinase family)
MVIIVLGPMGCGKTTIGKTLADQMGWQFFDADDYHPEANKQKMAQGIPLDDADRQPWLQTLHTMAQQHLRAGTNMILACSALKKKYRRILGIDQQHIFSVFLKGSYSLLKERISTRSHEYMAKDLLQSQLDTLEEPETGLTVDIAGTPDEICQIIKKHFFIESH